MTTTQLQTLTLLAAFAGGLALACDSGSSPNPEHCFNSAGDSTCAELYANERPFCVGPGESCDTTVGPDGCVAELPPVECYSPCGDGALAAEDSSCLPEPDDLPDDDDSSDDDDDSTGDGEDEPALACGDGMLAADEQCDDGNDIDDDDCSNACTLATCGDGIVQTDRGETCDDGDTQGGDGCAASCVLSGTVIWSRYSALTNAVGRSVAVAPNGNIGVIAYAGALGYRVIGLNSDGELLWNEAGPEFATEIAAGPNGEFVVAGVVADKGQIWRFGSTGKRTWTAEVPLASDSTLLDIRVDATGSILAGGSAFGFGIIWRVSSAGDHELLTGINSTSKVESLAVGADGWFSALTAAPRKVVRYDSNHVLAWESDELAPLGDLYAELTVDETGNTWVVGSADAGLEGFGLARLDADGGLQWNGYHDDDGVFEAAFSMVALPTGGVVVAGLTNADGENNESDGLLSHYGADGISMGDSLFDGDKNNDADWLQDIAIDSDGNIVAVGFHQPGSGDSTMWTLKVAM